MKLSLLIAIACITFSCNSSTANETPTGDGDLGITRESPDITVQVEGVAAGKASLIGSFADQRFRVDSSVIDNTGRIVLARDQPYDAGFYYLLLPDNSAIQMLIDTDQTFTMTTRAGNLMEAMQVEGSLDNELLYKNLKFEEEMRPRFEAVTQQLNGTPKGSPEYQQLKAQQEELVRQRKAHLEEIFTQYPNTLFTIFKQAGQNPEVEPVLKPDGTEDLSTRVYLYRSRFWDDVDFSDERLIRTPVISNKLRRYINELTVQHPDSINKAASFLLEKVLNYPDYYKFFTNWIALNYEPTQTTLMDPQAVYVHMIQNYFTYDRAFWADSAEIYSLQLRAHEMAASLIGQKGPDVTANDPSGKPRSISEIKAPYVVVYMYNPTCEHCMEQTPKLVRFYQEWKNKGVEVFGIAIDTNDAEWKNYIAKNGMNWINVFDPSNQAIYAKYFVDNTPEIYVLNPDRIIIGKNLKVSQIPEIIQRDQSKRQ